MSSMSTGPTADPAVPKILKDIAKFTAENKFEGTSISVAGTLVDINIFPAMEGEVIIIATDSLNPAPDGKTEDALAYWSISSTRGIEDLRQGAAGFGTKSQFSAEALVSAAKNSK